MERLAGGAPGALRGQRALTLVHPEDRGHVQAAVNALEARPRASTILEFRLGLGGSSERYVDGMLTNLLADDSLRGLVMNLRGATERKHAEAALAHQATHDPLTELPNRAFLLDRLTQASARARRDGSTLAVIFLDLDKFKHVNDEHGHAAGDDLLRDVATRLREAARENDSIARLGGDEFVVLSENVDGMRGAEGAACRIEKAMAPTFTIAGRPHQITISAGVAFSKGELDVATLLEHADAAMYRAKRLGRARIEFFDGSSKRRSAGGDHSAKGASAPSGSGTWKVSSSIETSV